MIAFFDHPVASLIHDIILFTMFFFAFCLLGRWWTDGSGDSYSLWRRRQWGMLLWKRWSPPQRLKGGGRSCFPQLPSSCVRDNAEGWWRGTCRNAHWMSLGSLVPHVWRPPHPAWLYEATLPTFLWPAFPGSSEFLSEISSIIYFIFALMTQGCEPFIGNISFQKGASMLDFS